MTLSSQQQTELTDLLDLLCDGTIAGDQSVRLQQLLLHNGDAQWFYLRYMQLHGTLLWDRQSRSERDAVQQLRDRGLPPSSVAGQRQVVSIPQLELGPPNLAIPSSAILNAAGYFSSGWPVAYLIASVILGVGLLIGTITHVSRPSQVVSRNLPSPSGRGVGGESNELPSPSGRGAGGEGGVRPDSTFPLIVGQITGTVDCRLTDGSKTKDQRPKTAVLLGDKFNLASGLLEITYYSGAKVILQGPVTYEVESSASGYLSLGRLTAKVASTRSQDLRPNTQDPNPKSPNLQISKFIARTPTATVTDLGTEFGVEVSKNGSTTSRVFRGSVRLQTLGPHAGTKTNAVTLHENESARVTIADGPSGGKKYVISLGASVTPADFVRRLDGPTIKVLDLVDVVAGGDGFSGRRNRGIDLRNGRLVDTISVETYFGDRKYHPVKETPLVDGVFIISTPSYDDPVQLDSAGHTVAGLSAGETQARGHVWAGGHDGVFSILDGIDYSTPGHGMIALHANSGVTFDLAAIRRANPGWKLLRFRGVAGLAEPTRSEHGASPHRGKPAEYEPDGLADLRVFVDGEVRFQRREVNIHTGALRAVVPIRDGDRFLTLVATHANNGITGDYTMFGDPQLELLPTATAAESTR
jgi:hypothetical protein